MLLIWVRGSMLLVSRCQFHSALENLVQVGRAFWLTIEPEMVATRRQRASQPASEQPSSKQSASKQ